MRFLRRRAKTFEQLATLSPPKHLLDQPGVGPWRDLGAKWIETTKMWAGLQPNHDVIDVGCGSGRMALALSQFLTGRYEGFDVEARAIKFCKEEIEPRWPRAHFQLIDVRNVTYNPAGSRSAAEFRFPYEDSSFDFALLTSVFTHMFTEEVETYLAEVARVLRRGGRTLVTYFLLNDDSRAGIDAGAAQRTFEHPHDTYCLMNDKESPLAAVAFDEAWVRSLYEQSGLTIADVHHGSWSGAPTCASARHSQDTIVATKPEADR